MEMTRRDFVVATAAACACAMCPFQTTLAADAKPIDVGALKDFAKDGVVDKFAEKGGFFVIRRGGLLYATSSQCTHKGGQVVYDAKDPAQLSCTKHKGFYNLQGAATGGKPKQSLPRLGISADAKGRVLVDASKQFAEKQWDQAGAFLKVEK